MSGASLWDEALATFGKVTLSPRSARETPTARRTLRRDMALLSRGAVSARRLVRRDTCGRYEPSKTATTFQSLPIGARTTENGTGPPSMRTAWAHDRASVVYCETRSAVCGPVGRSVGVLTR